MLSLFLEAFREDELDDAETFGRFRGRVDDVAPDNALDAGRLMPLVAAAIGRVAACLISDAWVGAAKDDVVAERGSVVVRCALLTVSTTRGRVAVSLDGMTTFGGSGSAKVKVLAWRDGETASFIKTPSLTGAGNSRRAFFSVI
jgi:hypothetical protein